MAWPGSYLLQTAEVPVRRRRRPALIQQVTLWKGAPMKTTLSPRLLGAAVVLAVAFAGLIMHDWGRPLKLSFHRNWPNQGRMRLGFRRTGKWCEAENDWQDLAQQVEQYPSVKAEAKRTDHLSGAVPACRPWIGANDGPVKIDKANGSLETSPENLKKHYPEGRVVRGLVAWT